MQLGDEVLFEMGRQTLDEAIECGSSQTLLLTQTSSQVAMRFVKVILVGGLLTSGTDHISVAQARLGRRKRVNSTVRTSAH